MVDEKKTWHDKVILIRTMQQELEQNTIIEERAIQLISECKFEEAANLLSQK